MNQFVHGRVPMTVSTLVYKKDITGFIQVFSTIIYGDFKCLLKEYSGSVIECLTQDRGAMGSSLTSVTVLCP